MLINKQRFSLVVAVLVIPFVLAACGAANKKEETRLKPTDSGMVGEQVQPRENLAPTDKIEFSDPGDDEIGKEIKQMDNLLNQTSPSEYSEDDLSESVIENDIELK